MKGLSFLCFVVFLVLKLCGAIDWSWGYVCLPAASFLGCAVWEEQIKNQLEFHTRFLDKFSKK